MILGDPEIPGIEVVDDLLPDPIKKLSFVSIWFAFAFSLYLLNRYHFSHNLPLEQVPFSPIYLLNRYPFHPSTS